jgi:hypothetical protein
MQGTSEAQTLSKIAEEAAFSMSDVAFISGLEESTVSRLWDNPSWLEKVSGHSLQALIATVPGLGEYVASHAMRSRRLQLIDELAAEGLEVNEPGIDRNIAAGIPEQYLSAALQAAVHIMRGDNAKASSYLARFWGAHQDKALTALFAPGEGDGLLRSPGQLVAASAELAPSVQRKGYSFHAIITQAVFDHRSANHQQRPGLGEEIRQTSKGNASSQSHRRVVVSHLYTRHPPESRFQFAQISFVAKHRNRDYLRDRLRWLYRRIHLLLGDHLHSHSPKPRPDFRPTCRQTRLCPTPTQGANK